jgi:hypothetical protein
MRLGGFQASLGHPSRPAQLADPSDQGVRKRVFFTVGDLSIACCAAFTGRVARCVTGLRLANGAGTAHFDGALMPCTTRFLVHLPHGAFQKCFLAFPVAAEETHLARVYDANNIVAVLKQETTAGVDNNGASDLAMPQ